MREVVGIVLSIIIIGVGLMVGGAMVAKTKNVTIEITNNDSLTYELADAVGDTMTTTAQLLPILVLAAIGGLALAYLIVSIGRMGGG
jgi:hypothetical protein